MDVREIAASETEELRRAVLRGGDMSADVHFPQDDDPASFHLGADDEGTIVAIATFTPAATPFRPDASAWQLRGMAIAESHQGRGIGSVVIAEAVARVRATGATVLWCNARDTALGFYERLGFVVHGDGFVTASTELPHHVMVLDL